MARPRVLLGGFLILLICGAAALALMPRDRAAHPAPRTAAEKPTLMILTTLPLLFPEEFTLQGAGSKALTALETGYRVIPIGTTDASSLKQAQLLLLAHPMAQTADALVDLDRWVRKGGRVMLLADPRLEWPSKRPLGDKLRPPLAFADTGLLAHWGLRLSAPSAPGQAAGYMGGQFILTQSPGRLSGACDIGRDGFVAFCRIGKGKATVVADADFLNVGSPGIHPEGEQNLRALIAELAALER